jgi:hypothetical protein
MATNIIQEPGYNLSVVVDHPATPASGDPVRFGVMTGVALTNEGEDGNATGYTSVYFGPCVVDAYVKGDNGSGSAVAVGDTIFFTDATTYHLDKTVTGYFFGFALETVESGATTKIRVYHPASPGAGTLSAGSVGTTQLAASGVTAVKLSATLKTGCVQLPLTGWRLIASNDIAAKNATDGGTISVDTSPLLKRVNGATDKQLKIHWTEGTSIEITNSFVYPPDLDDASPVTVKILAAMAGASDTPVVAVGYFEGVGDSNAGGNTAAVTGTTPAVYSVAIAHGNVGAAPQAASVTLVPGTHATDAVIMYAAWIEYTRA